MSRFFSCPTKLIITLFCIPALVLATGAAHAQTPMTFDKAFSPATIGPGSVSTLQFVITNNTSTPADTIAFSDTLPAGVSIAIPGSATTSCGAFAVLSAPDGGTTISLTDGQLAPNSSCSVIVNVTSSAIPTAGSPVTHTNVSGTLMSSIGPGGVATADLIVEAERPGLSKSFSPSTISATQISTLTLTIDNTSNPSGVGSLSLTDTLPTGLFIAPFSNASTNCGSTFFPPNLTAVPGTSVVSLFANGFLPNYPALDAASTCSVIVDVTTTDPGFYDNTTSDLIADSDTCGKATARLNVPLEFLEKSFIDDPAAPGGAATLAFRINNLDRNLSATDIAFTDDLAATLAGLTFSSLLANDCGGSVGGVGTTDILFSGGTLPPQGSCTIFTSLSVPAAAAPGAYANVTSSITASVGGTPVTGNTATDTLSISPAPLLTKEFVADPVNPGDPVVLQFTVTNTSSTSSATDIAFVDIFSTIMPTASVVPGADCCGAGSTCTFAPLSNPPPPSDAVPAQLSLSGGSLSPAGMAGDSCTFSITLDVAADAPPGIYTNVTSPIAATVDGALRAGLPAVDDLVVISAPGLSKAFIDDPVTPGGTVTLVFTLTHRPDAPGDATDITFTDNLATLVPAIPGLTANLPSTPDPPCGAGSTLTGSAGDTLLTLEGGTLAPGTNCTFSVTLDVPAAAAPGDHTNTTSGVGATIAGVPTTSRPAEDDLQIAGLTFSKEFIGDPVVPGETVILRFTIDNVHPTDDATAISFTDNLTDVLPGAPDLSLAGPLPATPCGSGSSIVGTSFLIFSGGEVPQGTSPCIFDISIQVPVGAPDGNFTNSTSSLSATMGGSPVLIDPATDRLFIDSDLLSLTKEFTDDPVVPGAPVNLRFTLTNLDGAQAASDIDFTDDLDGVLSGLVATGLPNAACGGTVSTANGGMTIDLSGGSLGAGAQCIFDVSVTVPSDAAANIYTNTTSGVTGTIGSLAVSGDAASDNLLVTGLLQFSKSFDGPSAATGTPVLTFTITNPGDTTAIDLSFSDDLDGVLSGLVATNLPLSDICGSGSLLSGTSFLTLTGGTLPPTGGTCSFGVDLLVPGNATVGTFPNTTSNLFDSGLPVAEPATADLIIEPAPTFAKVFAPDTIGLGFNSVLTLTINNSASAVAATNLDFTDDLPAGVIVAASPNPIVTCTGGTLTAVAGGGVISYTGGSVGAGATCTVQVDVTGFAAGTHINTTGDLTSSSGNSGTATDTLTVNVPPGFAKVFAPNPIILGGVSTLVFTIDNSAGPVAGTALDFTDILPAAVVVATPANASTTCTGGSLTAVSATGTIAYSGGAIAAGASCTVQADVTSSTSGDHVNTTSDLTSSLGNSGPATDTLTVTGAVGFAKVFTPNVINEGGISTLTFTIDNTGNSVDATALDFTDMLPGAIVVATPANASTTCTNGTLTAVPATGTVAYSGGTVAAGASCTVQADVTSSTPGIHSNTTGDLTSSLGNSGSATADLEVVSSDFTLTKAFTTNPVLRGGSVDLEFTVTNAPSSPDLTGIAFTDDLDGVLSGLVAVGLPAADICGAGSLVDGTTALALTGANLASGTSCTFSVTLMVPANAPLGTYTNITSAVTAQAPGASVTSPPATADFEVVFLPFDKAFSSQGNPGGTVTLTFTMNNPDPFNSADNISFTDDLDAVLPGLVAEGLPMADICGLGSQLSGTSIISLTNGLLGPLESCTFGVSLRIPMSAGDGNYLNTTSVLDATVGGTQVSGDAAGVASDSLTVLQQVAIPVLSTFGILLLVSLIALWSYRRLMVG